MGMQHDDHDGVSVETRRTSFYLYVPGAPSDVPDPEFLYIHVNDIVMALQDVLNSDAYRRWKELWNE